MFGQQEASVEGALEMNELIDRIPEASVRDLRHRFSHVEPEGWVSELARESGWQRANEEFLRAERERGFEEMRSLLAALRLRRPRSAVDATDLVETALRLYLPESEDSEAVQRVGETKIQLRICNCPNYSRSEAHNWQGVTACSTWHRRRGWYMALGVFPADSVQEERKWGSEACEAVIEFQD